MSRRALAIGGSALAALVVVIVAVALIAAVGEGSDESPTTAEPPVGAPLGGEVPEELQACLEEQGIEAPSGPPEAGAPPDPYGLEGIQACAEFLPEGPGGTPPAG